MPKQKRGRSKQDYATPPEFLAAVKDRYSIPAFDVDVAASPENAVADVYYTVKDNGLACPWELFGGWAWCNPPYADIDPWVEKAYHEYQDHGARSILLLPAGVGSNWFRDWCWKKSLVILLNGRMRFVGAADDYPKDLILIIHGLGVGIAIWSWNRGGAYTEQMLLGVPK